jgi:ABC-type uncharacterized transport system permease subunit
MLEFIPYLITAGLYLAVAAEYWRKPAQTASRARWQWDSSVIAFGLVLHGWLLYDTMFADGLNLGLTNALSAILWLTMLIYWLTDIQHKLHSLQAFVLPPAAAAVLLQKFVPTTLALPYAEQPLFMAHLIIALLAYSLFTFAALHALLMAVAERSLHNKTTWIKLPDFPPLLNMEKLLFRVIAVGFALLTLTLVSGVLFSEELFHQPMRFTHKNVFAVLSWLIFGGLLLGRYIQGWRGRTAIRWTLWGFALLVLAYLGSKLILQELLHRPFISG